MGKGKDRLPTIHSPSSSCAALADFWSFLFELLQNRIPWTEMRFRECGDAVSEVVLYKTSYDAT